MKGLFTQLNTLLHELLQVLVVRVYTLGVA